MVSKKQLERLCMALNELSDADMKKLTKMLEKKKVEGGAWYDFLDPNKNGVGNLYNKVKNEITNDDSILRREVVPAVIEGVKTASQVINTAKSLIGKGGKHKRQPWAANDPRRKRNELVKKAMKDHNLTLPQASKYVKEHS